MSDPSQLRTMQIEYAITKWVYDKHGNRASIEKWGSEEAARRSLDTLIYCRGCDDCEWCVGCEGCYRCEWCVLCLGCEESSWCLDSEGYCRQAGNQPHIPVVENIHSTIYAAASAPGALEMGDWHHECGTRHCRGGWTIALAGEAGRELERRYGTPMAAMMIYHASGYPINPGRLFDDDKAAIEDMKRLAQDEHGKRTPH